MFYGDFVMTKWKVIKEKPPKRPKEKKVKNPFPKWIFTTLAVVIITAAALAWALPNLPKKPQNQPSAQYKGVIELWNVETFEGGCGSRSTWLTNKSAKFESANKGLFVHVTNLSVEQLKQKLQDGQTFDLICFSRGVGNIVKDYLAPQTSNVMSARENFLISGQINGQQYAMPLYAGAYCLFARETQLSEDKLLSSALTATYTRKIGKNTVELKPLICGFTDFNSPLTALAMAGGKGDAAAIEENVTQYQAYEQFVSNKTAVTLLGTQRDLYRLSQKESQSKIEKLGFCALTGYTDLIQYVGISNTCGEKASSCAEYVNFLLTKEVQCSLVNLSMFSVLEQSIYTDEKYVSCENALAEAFVPNAFADGEVIANQRQTAKTTLAI